MIQHEDRALSILAAALEKEQKGRDFYKKASENCVNPLGKEIFKTLMVDEGADVKRVKEIFDVSLRVKNGIPTGKILKLKMKICRNCSEKE